MAKLLIQLITAAIIQISSNTQNERGGGGERERERENGTARSNDVPPKIVNAGGMLELHQGFNFVLPHHLSRNVKIPGDLTQSSIPFAIQPISLSDHKTLLGLQ